MAVFLFACFTLIVPVHAQNTGTIQLKRGNQSNLPTLAQGEPAVTLDTLRLWIGTAGGNKDLTGSRFFVGSGTPSTVLGYTGDVYFDTTASAFYQKSASGWGSPFATLSSSGGGDAGPVTQEVTDARTRDSVNGFDAQTYANLKAHLMALWTAVPRPGGATGNVQLRASDGTFTGSSALSYGSGRLSISTGNQFDPEFLYAYTNEKNVPRSAAVVTGADDANQRKRFEFGLMAGAGQFIPEAAPDSGNGDIFLRGSRHIWFGRRDEAAGADFWQFGIRSDGTVQPRTGYRATDGTTGGNTTFAGLTMKSGLYTSGTFSLAASDIPSLSASKITSGTMDPARLGTGGTGSGNKVLSDAGTFVDLPSGGTGNSTLPAFDLDVVCSGVWVDGSFNSNNWGDSNFPRSVYPGHIVSTSAGQVVPVEFDSPVAGTYRLYLDIPTNYNLSSIQVCSSGGSSVYGNVVNAYSASPGANLKADTGINFAVSEGWNKLFFKVITNGDYTILKRLRFVRTTAPATAIPTDSTGPGTGTSTGTGTGTSTGAG